MRYLVPYFIDNLLANLEPTDQLVIRNNLSIRYPKTYVGKVEAWKNLILNYNDLRYSTQWKGKFRYEVNLLPDHTVRIYDVALNKELVYTANESLCTDTMSSTRHIGIILRDQKLNFHI